MLFSGNLGFPRIGIKRELKFALENYWKGNLSALELHQTAEKIQSSNWVLQKEMGLDFIPSNDFSFYDHVLDTTMLLGAVPSRFRNQRDLQGMDLYFALARGYQADKKYSVPAMEMTKWFNTNYHYIVPEISPATQFEFDPSKPVDAFNRAKSLGILTRPVLLGPLSFLLLSKTDQEGFLPYSKLPEILPLYAKLLSFFKEIGVEWLQLDEPFLCSDLNETVKKGYQQLFQFFEPVNDRPKVMLTTYFGDLSANLNLITDSPFEGLHIDFTNCSNPDAILASLRDDQTVSLGLIDGRNIWKNDLTRTLKVIKEIKDKYHFQEMILTPSCSLIHIPQDMNLENDMDQEILPWLSFARQKLEEISELKKAANNGFIPTRIFSEHDNVISSRQAFLSQNKTIKHDFPLESYSRRSSFTQRKKVQQTKLNLPVLPTTTIGSFPQTGEIRKLRSDFQKGTISGSEYQSHLEKEVEKTIRFQEEIGLDVLVHGEFERSDMVQYFAEKLDGFMFTEYGWVQSFGSRYVRPPIIFGYVNRPKPITVAWSHYAQSLTSKPVKGMLTGPVTILQWSFVRDDQPRAKTCRQIAFAIRQEVLDLEKAGIRIIQIDEPAFREGMPIQSKEWSNYLDWAVECFRIASGAVQDETQIHTHMCYAEFNNIIEAIAKMDADVISIEASRSKMELLNAFERFNYPNDIGPGVYDIHSPIIPTFEEITALIKKALKVIPADQLWINPDCGLKTRQWEEVMPALKNMVNAAKAVRRDISSV